MKTSRRTDGLYLARKDDALVLGHGLPVLGFDAQMALVSILDQAGGCDLLRHAAARRRLFRR